MSEAPPFPKGVLIAKAGFETALFQLMCVAHADNGVLPLSHKKTWAMIGRIARKENVIAAVIPGPERLEAILLLERIEVFYSEETVALALLFYVHPLHRKTRHAMKLIQFARYWAYESKMPVVFGIETLHDAERKHEFMSRVARFVGGTYVIGDIPDAYEVKLVA